MVETVPVTSQDHFVTACSSAEENELNDAQLAELWELWSRYEQEHGAHKLVLVPEWFSESEFDARRPFLFTTVERDDADSGAVLFSDTDMVNISVIENEVLTDNGLPLESCVEELDVSDDDDYIDDPGYVWIPRSLMTVYERSN